MNHLLRAQSDNGVLGDVAAWCAALAGQQPAVQS